MCVGVVGREETNKKYVNVSNRGVKESHMGYVVVVKCTLGVINLCTYSMLGLIVVTTCRL